MSEKDEKTPAPKGLNRRQFLTRTSMGAGALVLSTTAKSFGHGFDNRFELPCSSEAWKFAVISDTQWTVTDDGYNPNSSAMGIAAQIQQQLIAAGVKFVIHVGDLCDDGSIAGEDTRARYAQALYDAGIGFFPVRGNHDDGAKDATEFTRIYPQTQTGIHNQTPSDVISMTFPAADTTNNPPASKTGHAFKVGHNFSSPDPWGTGDLKGLSYSFDFENSRFILLDQFTPPDSNSSYNSATTVGAQQYWISQQLGSRGFKSHAFVFAHKGLITPNHVDVLFGSTPATNPTLVNAFIDSLASNDVKYYINGHDHMYDRSIISDTVGQSSVTQILCASDSSKFYVPAGSSTNTSASRGTSSNDVYYDVPAFGISRRTPLAQELNIGNGTQSSPTPRDVGYYIFTVDGETVTAEYHAVTVPVVYASGSETIINDVSNLPAQNHGNSFAKREVFGYGLNGKQFLVASGASYTSVKDTSPSGNVARILAGDNASKLTDANQILLTKAVNTGWRPGARETLSDILYLYGMGSLANADPYLTDTYVLQISDNGGFFRFDDRSSSLRLMAWDRSGGGWVNAVYLNTGGSPQFVKGPWKSSYTLGAYGVDGKNVWAVVNFQGRFAVAKAGR